MATSASFVHSPDDSTAQATRLTKIFSHLRTRPKIVITRDLGPDASALISPKDFFEVLTVTDPSDVATRTDVLFR
jgi:hypothetical protein